MIAKDTFPVYAQYNEDIILASLLHEVKRGFYVDVGANHEEYHSVTKYFYQEGWSGINIEPIPRLMAEIKKKRPRDINLQLAISTKPGELTFREYPDYDGFSTLSSDSKKEPNKVNLRHNDYTVKVDSLKNIFDDNNVNTIDFLKIDVEGYEFEVLRSNDWSKYRPTIICIEANHKSSDWSKFLQTKKYSKIIFDGLNEYYLASESIRFFEGFAERAALLSHNGLRIHHIKQWTADIDRIKFLEDVTERQDALIKSMDHALKQKDLEIEMLHKLSLHSKSYKNRLKISAKGLTSDYYRQKRAK